MRCFAGVLGVSVEDFDADICADGVAHENDKVVGFVGAVLGGDEAGCNVLVHAVYLAVDVPGGVAWGEGLVLFVRETEEVAAVDVVGGG